ncbi:hypothetical protein Lal_00042181 [Lupinus albus]|uniref:Putative transcription factor C2C2-GATA family n=1 Tax=Lupinus albus TaxID=3870 RepID=A0A6A4NHA4_LUPAL|nr:putative transcription factor C2C2-GATA family [Lupinus albus]KAF1883423.1 hypothetical protein Lal_00042181 [Lupinus albus]
MLETFNLAKMNVYQNVSVSNEFKQEQVLPPSCSNNLDDLFSSQNTEVDVGLEWLSVFVEDCFSSPSSCFLGPASVQSTTDTSSKPSTLKRPHHQNESSLQNFTVPGKARSKRKRLSAPRTIDPIDPLRTIDPLKIIEPLRTEDPLRTSSMWSQKTSTQNEAFCSDPPLLKQAYWLADSELFVPKEQKDDEEKIVMAKEEEEEEEEAMMLKGIVMSKESFVNCESNNGQQHPMPRRCTHCLSQRTPQWRAGPLGPKTLCNACGVRYKSGRLLPEYRPAKSPTFVSYLHSNSHKKVMEMRMAVLPSIPSEHK